MSGHSKWATIKHAKEANDKKKGALLSRASKDIILAVQIGGGGDVNFNPMLRVAITKAKSVNMTNDKIERAINKGLGIGSDNEIIYEKTYEAYLPGNVPILIDCETDNPNRTLTDVKTIVNKLGGKFLSEGAISWRFKELGEISIAFDISIEKLEEDFLLLLMDVEGIKDYEVVEKQIKVYTQKQSLRDVHSKISQILPNTFSISGVKLVKIFDSEGNLENPEKVMEYVEKIEEVPEVLDVWVGI